MKAVRTGNWGLAHLLALNAEHRAKVASLGPAPGMKGEARSEDDDAAEEESDAA